MFLCPFTRAHYPNVIRFRHPTVRLHYYQILYSFDSFGYFLICPTHPILTTSDVSMSIIIVHGIMCSLPTWPE
ncbi:hypothetical protein Hanom_Chr16g01508221 [Helianthus anomalus]